MAFFELFIALPIAYNTIVEALCRVGAGVVELYGGPTTSGQAVGSSACGIVATKPTGIRLIAQ